MDTDTIYDDTIGTPDTPGTSQARGSAARQVVLAGIGAVATAFDTAEQCFDRFVDRGQEVQSEMQERSDDVRRQNWRARNRARDYFRGAMDMVLDTFNVPSRTDVDTINVKLNILTRKLDDLQVQTVAAPAEPSPAATMPEPTPAGEPPVTGDLTT